MIAPMLRIVRELSSKGFATAEEPVDPYAFYLILEDILVGDMIGLLLLLFITSLEVEVSAGPGYGITLSGGG